MVNRYQLREGVVAPTAIVEDGASLGKGVQIWNFSQVRSGASLGDGTVLGKDCFVDAGVVIGERCKIQNGSQIYAPAILHDGVFVGPRVVLTNDRYPRAISPTGALLGADDWQAIGCVLEEGCAVGAASVIICTTVGAWATVGAGSVVTHSVKPHALVVGNPARQIGWVCFCGRRADGLCAVCGWIAPTMPSS